MPKVFIVDNPAKADYKVYVVDYASKAEERDFVVDFIRHADKKVYVVDDPKKADKKVFFVEFASQADIVMDADGFIETFGPMRHHMLDQGPCAHGFHIDTLVLVELGLHADSPRAAPPRLENQR